VTSHSARAVGIVGAGQRGEQVAAQPFLVFHQTIELPAIFLLAAVKFFEQFVVGRDTKGFRIGFPNAGAAHVVEVLRLGDKGHLVPDARPRIRHRPGQFGRELGGPRREPGQRRPAQRAPRARVTIGQFRAGQSPIIGEVQVDRQHGPHGDQVAHPRGEHPHLGGGVLDDAHTEAERAYVGQTIVIAQREVVGLRIDRHDRGFQARFDRAELDQHRLFAR
jgi:hypothetical protein